MIKIYQVYLIKLFFKKLIITSLLFLFLTMILNIFGEISFFRDSDVNLFLPILMSALNAPSTIFEIFPFIFLIATQFFFLELIDKEELEFLKLVSLNNIKIIKILFFTSFTTGVLLLSLYYGISSKLKFVYFDIKNSYSNDNKYLAVVKESGLWIKDEIDNKIYIINAHKIEGNYLLFVSLNEFDENFNLIRIIESDKIDIFQNKWSISNPTIIKNNKIYKSNETIFINTHFNRIKINSMFENLASLNIFQLLNLEKDYKLLGYSTTEIKSHLHKLYSFPFFLSIMTVLSAITMLNIKRNRSTVFHLIFGIFLSVLIYYLYYLFNLLGVNGKIPLLLSIYLPILILSMFILMGLIRINEK